MVAVATSLAGRVNMQHWMFCKNAVRTSEPSHTYTGKANIGKYGGPKVQNLVLGPTSFGWQVNLMARQGNSLSRQSNLLEKQVTGQEKWDDEKRFSLFWASVLRIRPWASLPTPTSKKTILASTM